MSPTVTSPLEWLFDRLDVLQTAGVCRSICFSSTSNTVPPWSYIYKCDPCTDPLSHLSGPRRRNEATDKTHNDLNALCFVRRVRRRRPLLARWLGRGVVAVTCGCCCCCCHEARIAEVVEEQPRKHRGNSPPAPPSINRADNFRVIVTPVALSHAVFRG